MHGLFQLRKSLARNHPLASPLLSAGRRDAAVWTSRLRSGNFVWRHVLNMCPSASCRLAFAQVVAAGPKRNLGPQWVCLARTDSHFGFPEQQATYQTRPVNSQGVPLSGVVPAVCCSACGGGVVVDSDAKRRKNSVFGTLAPNGGRH